MHELPYPINPRSEAHQISGELAELLDEHVTDFDIRYCYVRESDKLRMAERLERLAPVQDDERAAIRELLRVLRDDEPVELMYSG